MQMHDAQLAEKKPARARNKSCATKAVARGVCEHTFILSQEIASCERKSLRQDAAHCPGKMDLHDRDGVQTEDGTAYTGKIKEK